MIGTKCSRSPDAFDLHPAVQNLPRPTIGAPLPPNYHDLPLPGNYRTHRSWNDIKREQLANPKRILMMDSEVDALKAFDQAERDREAQDGDDYNLKGDTEDELNEA